MRPNEKNDVISQLLTESEIKEVYARIDESYNKYIMEHHGQQVFDFRMPESVMDKILQVCKSISGQDDLVLEAYQFARYEKFTRPDGVVSIPKLIPHYDTFDQPRFTFDYQLGSNTTWPIFVEGKEIILGNNDAVTFSGTHQVHWRPEKQWEDGEYIDMIFCHLHSPSITYESSNHTEVMTAKVEQFAEQLRVGK